VKKWADANLMKADGKTPLQRYTAQPSEISLVDRPCMPNATFFEIQKADGTLEKVDFKDQTQEDLTKTYWTLVDLEPEADLIELVEKRDFTDQQREKMADKGTAMKDGSFPIANEDDLKNAIKAYGRAKDKDAAKAHIEARAKALKLESLIPDAWDKVDAPKEYNVAGSDAQVAALAKLMDEQQLDLGVVIKAVESHLVTIKRDVAAAALQKLETDGQLRKGFWLISSLAEIAERLNVLRSSINYEEASENDADSALPRKVKEACAAVYDLLSTMVVEETAEYLGTADKEYAANPASATEVMAMMAKADSLEPLRQLVKMSKDEDAASKAQKIHDLAAGMGAKCDSEKHDHGDLAKLEGSPALAKLVADEVGKLTKEDKATIDLLKADIKKLQDQPMPPKEILRVVSKSDDTNELGARGEPDVTPILKADGTVNEFATAVKRQHAKGGQPYVEKG